MNVKLRRWKDSGASCLLVVLAGAAGALIAAQKPAAIEQKALETYELELKKVRVSPPERAPEPSQQDIDLAMALYSIRLPRGLQSPAFDPALEDRGLTTGSSLLGPQHVTIGPAAFSSWPLLGSTLAHEVEVHGQQNFFRIVLEDEFFGALTTWSASGRALAGSFADAGQGRSLCSACGTLGAEREAYQYEIQNAQRFGLSELEIRLIRQVMDTYYPEDGVAPEDRVNSGEP